MYFRLMFNLFQICKIKFKFGTSLWFSEKDSAFKYSDPDSIPILEWIGFKEGDHSHFVLRREKDGTYLEDKVTVSLFLLAGSNKVCNTYSIPAK